MNTKDRNKKIVEYRKRGYSQSDISNIFKITRQRVQQIETKLCGPRRKNEGRIGYSFKCKQCGKDSSAKSKGRKYCSRECFFKFFTLSDEEKSRKREERREKNRIRSYNYYHEVFKKRDDWRKIVKRRNMKYLKKNK